VRKRLRCFWHQESTPSLVQRKDGWYCYGACNRLYPNDEVEKRTGEKYEYVEESEPEDLTERFNYIRSLPPKTIRGLQLPADEGGYFVIWPYDKYYKYRFFNPGDRPKYVGAKGRTPPLFWARRESNPTLIVSEGEINALSIALAFPQFDVCSPGSCSMFRVDKLSKDLTSYQGYSNLVVVMDKDKAADEAMIHAKAFFRYKIPFTDFIQLEQDANELLQERGPQGLKQEMEKALRAWM